MIRTAKITIKSTGEQFWYDYRDSWNTRYYSFDSGATWHRTKSEAYRTARATSTLHRVGEVKVVVAA